MAGVNARNHDANAPRNSAVPTLPHLARLRLDISQFQGLLPGSNTTSPPIVTNATARTSKSTDFTAIPLNRLGNHVL